MVRTSYEGFTKGCRRIRGRKVCTDSRGTVKAEAKKQGSQPNIDGLFAYRESWLMERSSISPSESSEASWLRLWKME